MNDIAPPIENEFELTLFGNGYGECILMHMGNNNWVIVDSCSNPWTNKIAPIEYLELMGVDFANHVKVLVLSHWHDDHIKGASKICELCDHLNVAISSAMHQRDFFRFVNVVNQRPVYSFAGKSTDEISGILKIMLERKNTSGEHYYKWASTDKILYHEKINNDENDPKIIALSPSDHSITAASIEIAKLIPKANTQIKINSKINPNVFAIVLWVSVGNIKVLLGSDLEEYGHPRGAWSVISSYENKPKGRADIFKVPHHGSRNAFCSKVYDEMLSDKQISVLTPFTHGQVILPKSSDIQRLKNQKYSHLYMACRASGKKITHEPVVEKIFKESAKNRKTLNSFGSITLRKNMDSEIDDWQIIPRGDAYRL